MRIRFSPKKRLAVLALLLLAAMTGWWMLGTASGDSAAEVSSEVRKACGGAGDRPPAAHGGAVSGENARETLSGQYKAPAPFRVISSAPEETRVEFLLPQYSVEDVQDESGRVWQRLNAEGASPLRVPGMPALPLYRMEYGSVPGSQVTVELQEAEYTTIEACCPAPGMAMALRDEKPVPTLPSAAVYGAGVVFPRESLRVASCYQLRGIQGNGVTVAPFQYDDAQGSVRALTRAVFSVRTAGNASVELDENGDFAAIQREFFANGSSFRRVEPNSTVGVLAMVVPAEWRDDSTLQEYLCWKERQGWKVLVGEYPSETGKGRDGILAWVRKQYEEESLTHLLLLGDYNAVPPYQHATGKVDINNIFSYKKVASDTPYSLLSGEGDLSYPDVFLGRIPVRNKSFAAQALRRMMEFERGEFAESTWTTRGIYIGSNEAAETWPNWGMEDWRVIQQQQLTLEKEEILRDGATYYEKRTGQYKNSQEAVAADIDNGASALYYLGHGGCVFFYTTMYSTGQALKQDNKGRLPLVFAPVCNTGKLDHADYRHDYAKDTADYGIPSLGQAFFESENASAGVAGAILATDETLWEPPIVQVCAFTAALKRSRSTGRLSSQGAYALESLYAAVSFCETYADEYYKSTEHHPYDNGGYTVWDGILHAWEVELLGDPTTVCRIGEQVPLTVSAEEKNGSLAVCVRGLSSQAPEPVENCSLAVWTEEGATFAARTDAEGMVTLPLREFGGQSAWLRVLDGSGPMADYPWRNVDGNQDGCVSNEELQTWLSWWQENYDPASAQAEWMRALRETALEKWRNHPDAPKPEDPEEPTVTEFAERLYEVDLACQAGTLASLAQAGVVLRMIGEEQVTALVNEKELDCILERDFTCLAIRAVKAIPPAIRPEEIQKELEELSAENWPWVRPAYWGMTEGGREITGVRISLADEDAAVPQMLLMAGIHGEETEAVAQVRAFLNMIRENLEGSEGTLAELLKKCVLWVVPVLNPDGYASGKHDNLHGVDLERGFPEMPGRLAEGDSCGLEAPWKYPGFKRTESCRPQREQSALVRWLVAHPVQAVLDLRQGDEYVAWTASGDAALARRLAAAAGMAKALPQAERYPMQGTLQQWMTDYLECHALELSIREAAPSGSSAILQWLDGVLEESGSWKDERGDLHASLEGFSQPGQFLPGVELAVPVSLMEMAYPLVLRLEFPFQWQGGCPETEERIVRSGEGYLDVALMVPEQTEGLCLALTPSVLPDSVRLALAIQEPSSPKSCAKVLVSAPERRREMTLAAEWCCLAVPLAGIRPEQLGLARVVEFSQGGFREYAAEYLEPGKGYWVRGNQPFAGCVSGWWLDPKRVTVEAGWQLLGTTAPQILPADAYHVDAGGSQLLPAGTRGASGTAYWRHFEQEDKVIP